VRRRGKSHLLLQQRVEKALASKQPRLPKDLRIVGDSLSSGKIAAMVAEVHNRVTEFAVA
jgi:hypothetical protein